MMQTKIAYFTSFTLLSAALLTACSANTAGSAPDPAIAYVRPVVDVATPLAPASEPESITHSVSFDYPSYDTAAALIEASDLIVRGEFVLKNVQDVRLIDLVISDGIAYNPSQKQVIRGNYAIPDIYTIYEFSVQQVYKGSTDGLATLLISDRGGALTHAEDIATINGTWGTPITELTNLDPLTYGEGQYIFFLNPYPYPVAPGALPAGLPYMPYSAVSPAQGQYLIDDQGELMSASNDKFTLTLDQLAQLTRSSSSQ